MWFPDLPQQYNIHAIISILTCQSVPRLPDSGGAASSWISLIRQSFWEGSTTRTQLLVLAIFDIRQEELDGKRGNDERVQTLNEPFLLNIGGHNLLYLFVLFMDNLKKRTPRSTFLFMQINLRKIDATANWKLIL